MAESRENGGPRAVNPHLSDFRDLPAEKQKAIAAAAGKKSGEVRRMKKTFRNIAKSILDLQAPEEVAAKVKKFFPGLPENEIDNRAAMICAQLARALEGDSKAFEVIRDTAGEKPTDRIELKNVNEEPFEIKVVE